MAATAPAVATTEIGYAQAVNSYWWLYQDESTPELIWPQSISVYDSMRRTDSQVTSVIRAMTLPVRSTPWRLDPNGASDEVVEFVAENLGLPVVGQPAPLYAPRQKDRFSWPEHLRQALLMLPFGHMFFEQLYRVDDSGNRARLRKLAPRMPKTIERIDVAADGGLLSIKQVWTQLDRTPRPIPVDRLVAYVHEREGGNWLGQSILRPAYKNWLLKDRLLRVQAQTIERNGMGIPLYRAQEGASAEDIAKGLAMAKAWRAGEAAGSAVPFGADLALVGVQGTLPDSDPAIRYHDEQIGRAVLAHFLNLGTQTGSWALGTTFADFFTLSLQTLAMQIADTATCHIVEDLVDINFGPDEPAPKIVFDEIGSRQAVTADALVALFGANILTADDRLEESLRQQYGLPPRDVDSARTPPGQMPAYAGDTSTAGADMGAQSVAASAGPVNVSVAVLADLADRVETLEAELGDLGLEDVEDFDLDFETEALLVAMAEFAGEVQAAGFNPSLHARYPKGHPLAGKFRPMVERLVEALKYHAKSGGNGDPFTGFDREQLRRAAVTRHLTLKRGASREDIRDALIADLSPKSSKPSASPATPAAPKVTTKKMPTAPGMFSSHMVAVNGIGTGAIHQSSTGTWFADPNGTGKIAYNSRKAAIDALVNPTAAPLPTAPPGARKVPVSVAGVPNVTATKVPIPGRHVPSTTMHGAKQSQDIHLAGVHIGTVHQYTGSIGWLADDPSGNPQAIPGGRTRADAIKALVANAANKTAQAPAPGSIPGVTTRPIPGTAHMQGTFLVVSYGGSDIGEVYNNALGWIAADTHRATIFNANGGYNFPTKDDAIQALVDAHNLWSNAPPATPHVPLTSDPAVKAAQDIIYGTDPKAKTASRQLAVYGALRQTHFDALDPAEQQTLLGDLSYIATTSKGPNGAKAQKIFDRFMPAGTPPGTIPPQSGQIVGPASAAQTRLPTPTAGLLQQAAKSGVRGDEWISGTNGGRVWGKYGSGGVLLRHVDSQGVERFLMTQRGPAISDPGKWSYPGGAYESLEDFYQGATREVAEELGFTDADFAPATVHGYHVFERADVPAVDGRTGAAKPWTYHSVAADVPTMLVPDLGTHHARAETSDAKWLTRAEIERLDQRGELHGPVAGGKLQQNVMSLFPPATPRPGARTTRPDRLTGTPKVKSAHKPSKGVDLIGDTASRDKLRQDVKKARKQYAGKTADDRLAAIGAMQGFDDTPTVLPKREIDRLLATGDYVEAFRGVRGAGAGRIAGGARGGGTVSRTKTAAQVNEDMRSGVAYYGTGVFGNGYYLAEDRAIAAGYADHSKNSVVRVLIPKSARTVDHKEAMKGATAASAPRSQAKGNRFEDGTLYDEGRYAAAKGYAGVRIPHTTRGKSGMGASHVATHVKHAWLWLDRSTLIIQEAD